MSVEFVALALGDEEADPVDCGRCPVNLACAIGASGSGWTYSCCNATAAYIEGAPHIVDCGRHSFPSSHAAVKECKLCPLCSGHIMLTALTRADMRYVPTVHAKVPLRTRLAVFRDGLLNAREQQARREREDMEEALTKAPAKETT